MIIRALLKHVLLFIVYINRDENSQFEVIMATNKNPIIAKHLKNDEFYTQYKDIEDELNHYIPLFENKVIYCNCDHYAKSNFVKYFIDNFVKFKIKKLVATCYSNVNSVNTIEYNGIEVADLFDCGETRKITNEAAYKMVASLVDFDNTSTKLDNGLYITVTKLNGDGDFRSEECKHILSECDMVITNPPSSLFREYITLVSKYDVQLIIMGNSNAVTYLEVFSLIKENNLWKGYSYGHYEFIVDYGTMETKKIGSSCWYTNIDINKRHERFETIAKYSVDKYPEYDNYYAINVDRVWDIPNDYDDVMGVPITFLDFYCPEQYEIVNPNDYKKKYTRNQVIKMSSEGSQLRAPSDRWYINGQRKFARVFIKKIKK